MVTHTQTPIGSDKPPAGAAETALPEAALAVTWDHPHRGKSSADILFLPGGKERVRLGFVLYDVRV